MAVKLKLLFVLLLVTTACTLLYTCTALVDLRNTNWSRFIRSEAAEGDLLVLKFKGRDIKGELDIKGKLDDFSSHTTRAATLTTVGNSTVAHRPIVLNVTPRPQPAVPTHPQPSATVKAWLNEPKPREPAGAQASASAKPQPVDSSVQTLDDADSSALTQKKPTELNASSQTHPQPTQPPVPPTGSGYLIATLSIYEQQTMATGSIVQLQCFASKLNLSVVQPLMKNSFFSTPLNWSEHADMLQMEDIYNMKEWREHTGGKGYAPLVRWEEFIDHAPRDVILVQMKHLTLDQIYYRRKRGNKFPRPVSEDKEYETGCDHRGVSAAFEILKQKKFRVIKKVCFNFEKGDNIPMDTYLRDLYGGANHSRVTVIMDEWRGFGGPQRVLIKEKICPGCLDYREYVNSSARVDGDAVQYADKYLTSPNATAYLAIMARYEWTAMSLWYTKGNKTDRYAIIPYCLQKTLDKLASMREEGAEGLPAYLSSDFGKYGSTTFSDHNYYKHRKDLEDFVSSVYGGQLNISEWERTFESVVESTDAGYVAKVQQAIVARAKCVLFVGGGTFQRHTFHLYKQLHPDPADWCVRVLKECTNPHRPIS